MKKSTKLFFTAIVMLLSISLMVLGALAAGGFLGKITGEINKGSIKSEEDILVKATVWYKIAEDPYLEIGFKEATSEFQPLDLQIDMGTNDIITFKIAMVNYGKKANMNITVSDVIDNSFSGNFSVSGSPLENFSEMVSFSLNPQTEDQSLMDITNDEAIALEEGFETESTAVFYVRFNLTAPTTSIINYTMLLAFTEYETQNVTLSFESNGGSCINPITSTPGTSLSKPENPLKNGYDFDAWCINESLEEEYVFDVMPSEDTLIYARWIPAVYSITYFNLQGGINPESNPDTYTIESAELTFANPMRTGYNGSWNITSIPTGSTGDIIITAEWTPIVYTITYENLIDGINPSSNPASYTIEDEIIFADPGGRTGCMGTWNPAGLPIGSTGDITVTAVWIPILTPIYTITYENLRGGINPDSNPATYTIEDEIIFANPTGRTGYTGTWNIPNIQTGSTGDVTVTAVWTPITYTITYENLLDGTNPISNSDIYTIEDEIIFANPTRTGYMGTWDIASISIGSMGDVTVTVIWTPIVYTITYENLQGYTNPQANPNNYTIEDEIVFVELAVINGYTFTWNPDIIPVGSSGDITVTAVWAPIIYTIIYENLLDGTNSESNPVTYTIEDEIIFADPTRTGYNGSWNILNIPTGNTGDITITAVWTPIIYTITYINLRDGTNPSSNPDTYTIETNTIMFSNPIRTGYTGIWTMEILHKGSTGNMSIGAVWTPVIYSITYSNLQGSLNPPSNPKTYTIETNTITFAAPIGRTGYTVIWNPAGIDKGSTGNKTITAVWTPIAFPITYENLQGGTNPASNPATYTIEDTITFAAPTGITGYTGTWNPVSIDKGSTGHKTITAVWTPTVYTITYENLQGYTNPKANPNNYTIEDEIVFVELAIINGYTFTWNPDIIPVGSTGDITVTAVWTPITYTITYSNLLTGTNPSSNPATYTIEDTITFAAPTGKTGYTGTWNPASIPKGSTGNKTITAVWTPIVYTITYSNLQNGTNPASNPATYTIETNTITFSNPTRTGYTGTWNPVSIAKGSTGNKTITAVWTPIVYTITYANLQDGTNQIWNPVTYTIETNTIIFSDPSRLGYTGSWDTASIPKGSTGNKTITAVWTINEYRITYDWQGGTPLTPATIYVAYGSSYKLATPSKSGLSFMGWYAQANGAGKRYTDPYGNSLNKWDETSHMTLYAFYTETVTMQLDADIDSGGYHCEVSISSDLEPAATGTTVKAAKNAGFIYVKISSYGRDQIDIDSFKISFTNTPKVFSFVVYSRTSNSITYVAEYTSPISNGFIRIGVVHYYSANSTRNDGELYSPITIENKEIYSPDALYASEILPNPDIYDTKPSINYNCKTITAPKENDFVIKLNNILMRPVLKFLKGNADHIKALYKKSGEIKRKM